MITEAEANALVAADKVITANVRWQPLPARGSNGRYWLEVGVLVLSSNAYLKLRGSVGKTNRSLVLICDNQPIRKYTVHYQHHNPTCTWLREPHKHTWTDDYEDGEAYVPPDMAVGNINDEFRDFLKECNIGLLGTYQPLLIQVNK